jgi:hypothetical protein
MLSGNALNYETVVARLVRATPNKFMQNVPGDDPHEACHDIS